MKEIKMSNKEAEKRLNRIIKAVEKFNAELAEYTETTESNELPDIGTTIVGSYSELEPAKITLYRKMVKVTLDGWEYKLRPVYDCGELVIEGWDDYYNGLRQDLAYQRARLRKGWRIWRSADPDQEELKDEDVD